jgi:hypothetical protein
MRPAAGDDVEHEQRQDEKIAQAKKTSGPPVSTKPIGKRATAAGRIAIVDSNINLLCVSGRRRKYSAVPTKIPNRSMSPSGIVKNESGFTSGIGDGPLARTIAV